MPDQHFHRIIMVKVVHFWQYQRAIVATRAKLNDPAMLGNTF